MTNCRKALSAKRKALTYIARGPLRSALFPLRSALCALPLSLCALLFALCAALPAAADTWPVLPYDVVVKTHPLINAEGDYSVEYIAGDWMLMRTRDGRSVAIQPFYLHREAIILVMMFAALWLFSKRGFAAVALALAVAFPAVIALFLGSARAAIPAPLAVAALALLAAAGMKVILGEGRKGTIAALSVALSVPALALFLYAFLSFAKVSGFSESYIELLDYVRRAAGETLPSYLMMITLATLCGAIGSMCDMSADITSAAVEMADRKTGSKPSASSLIRLSQHAVGSMTNTLLLAFAGGHATLFMSWMAIHEEPMVFWNREMVAVEIIRSVGGSFGFLLTAVISTFILKYLIFNDKIKHQLT